jgi:hypothetical protein
MQVINNAVHVLMQASIFPLNSMIGRLLCPKHIPPSRLSLRRHIRDAFMRSNSITLQGSRGTRHSPTICTLCLLKRTTLTQWTPQQRTLRGLTTGSTITGEQTATILASVANAINQLSTNQTALMNQMGAMLYANVPPPQNLQYQPPIQQLTIPSMLTTGSTITGEQTATIPTSFANAINQLSANQTALMNQMAAMSYANVPPPQNLQYQPPIQQLTIPVQQPCAAAATGGFNSGNGGGGRGGRSRQGHGRRGGGRNQHTPFTNYGYTQGVRSDGQGRGGGRFIPQATGAFNPQAPTFVPPNTWNIPVPLLNAVKSYANWNVCYSCRFDIEDSRTSIMCHKTWRTPNHQEGFTYANALEYLNVGWDPCTKGMHKSQLPGY